MYKEKDIASLNNMNTTSTQVYEQDFYPKKIKHVIFTVLLLSMIYVLIMFYYLLILRSHLVPKHP